MRDKALDNTERSSHLNHRESASSPTKRILYVEPFSGISGDMFLGALLDLGQDRGTLLKKLAQLPLRGYEVNIGKCSRAGIEATRVEVLYGDTSDHRRERPDLTDAHPIRTFADIRQMIESSALSGWVRKKSIEAFRRLAESEGKIHDQPPEKVHFHEVGAVDSIIDIVGSMIAVEELAPTLIISAPINLGQGTLECRHGLYPAPGPATVELLLNVPVYAGSIGGELTTPTGAALVTTLADRFEPRPLMRIRASGYGAGSRDIPGVANVLRLTLGDEESPSESVAPEEMVAVIEANIDDMNPQIYSYFEGKALSEGALDVFATPIQMKKSRPAVKVTVICAPGELNSLTRLIFSETTTIGVRYTFAHRKTLQRYFRKVQTEYGEVTIKESFMDGRRTNFVPEYGDCCRLAAEKGVALKLILAAAMRRYLEHLQEEEPKESNET